MKPFKKILFALLLASPMLFLFSCKKDVDPAPSGNKVKVYMLPGAVFSVASPLLIVQLDSTFTIPRVDSSLILLYFKDSSNTYNWYQAGELGYGATYLTKWGTQYYGSNETLFLQVYNTNGSTYSGADVDIPTLKMIVAPVDGFSGKKDAVNYTDYKATMRYFGLPE